MSTREKASGEGGRVAVAGVAGVALLILLCSAVGFELKSLGSGSPRTRHRRPSPSRPLFDNFVPEKQKKRRERERESKRKKPCSHCVCLNLVKKVVSQGQRGTGRGGGLGTNQSRLSLRRLVLLVVGVVRKRMSARLISCSCENARKQLQSCQRGKSVLSEGLQKTGGGEGNNIKNIIINSTKKY